MQKNNMKLFIIPIIALSMFVLLLFGAGYAYYTASSAMNTAYGNVVMPLRTILSCVKQDASIAISYNNMYSNKAGTVVGTNTAYVNCTCSGAVGSSCDYSVYFGEMGTTYTPSSGIGSNKEFTVIVSQPIGCTAKNGSSSETQVNTMVGKQVSSCSLTIPSSGSITASIGAQFKWYNLNLSQDTHASKTYKYFLSTGSEIPDAYQRVEYVQSSGTQYFDTGYYATEKTVVEAKLFTTDGTNRNWFGGSSDANKSFVFNSYSKNKFEYRHASSGWTTVNTTDDIVNADFIVEYGNGAVKINGTSVTTLPTTSFTDYRSICIFVRSGGSAYISGKVYYFKIYENGSLVKNLVPCYRKIDNVAGLYDTVSGTFYTNKGSGSFTAGPNV